MELRNEKLIYSKDYELFLSSCVCILSAKKGVPPSPESTPKIIGGRAMIEKVYSTREACELVGISVHVVRNWRRQGLGPKPSAITPGGIPRYTVEDIVNWYREFYQYRAYDTGGNL